MSHVQSPSEFVEDIVTGHDASINVLAKMFSRLPIMNGFGRIPLSGCHLHRYASSKLRGGPGTLLLKEINCVQASFKVVFVTDC
jgi:hypothetical protein